MLFRSFLKKTIIHYEDAPITMINTFPVCGIRLRRVWLNGEIAFLTEHDDIQINPNDPILHGDGLRVFDMDTGEGGQRFLVGLPLQRASGLGWFALRPEDIARVGEKARHELERLFGYRNEISIFVVIQEA